VRIGGGCNRMPSTKQNPPGYIWSKRLTYRPSKLSFFVSRSEIAIEVELERESNFLYRHFGQPYTISRCLVLPTQPAVGH
jgi:hypothetical protein